MTKEAVRIDYGDVAVGAKEAFDTEATNVTTFSDLSILSEYNVPITNYGNPCELYSVMLDGKTAPIPSDYSSNKGIGIWADSLSNENGLFNSDIEIALDSGNSYFTSAGFTFGFDRLNNIFPQGINIKWYQIVEENEVLLAEKDFVPDSGFYFCSNLVDQFNKVIITFSGVNMPHNRLRITSLDYGYGTSFFSKDIRNISIIQEIDPISSEISANVADITLDINGDVSYSFQEKQAMSIYFEGDLKQLAFIKKVSRQSKSLWRLTCEDYIALMEKVDFVSVRYIDNAYNVFKNLFQKANIPCTIAEEFKNISVDGTILNTNCREALLQVAFAAQAVIDTSETSRVNVVKLSNEEKVVIPKERVFQGQKIESDEVVTSVSIGLRRFGTKNSTDSNGDILGEEADRIYMFQVADRGQTITIKSDTPHRNYKAYGDIELINDSYYSATIFVPQTANRGYVYASPLQVYDDVKTKKNPLYENTNTTKEINISNIALITDDNVDKVLNACYDWLMKTTEVHARILEGKHVSGGGYVKYGQNYKYGQVKYAQKEPEIVTYDEKIHLGDIITIDTEYLGKMTGRIIRQKYTLNGGVIVKDVVLRL